MNRPPQGLSPAEINALLAEVERGAVRAETAIELMVYHGAQRDEAVRRVLLALPPPAAHRLRPPPDLEAWLPALGARA